MSPHPGLPPVQVDTQEGDTDYWGHDAGRSQEAICSLPPPQPGPSKAGCLPTLAPGMSSCGSVSWSDGEWAEMAVLTFSTLTLQECAQAAHMTGADGATIVFHPSDHLRGRSPASVQHPLLHQQ
jgi:hypothetical protein